MNPFIYKLLGLSTQQGDTSISPMSETPAANQKAIEDMTAAELLAEAAKSPELAEALRQKEIALLTGNTNVARELPNADVRLPWYMVENVPKNNRYADVLMTIGDALGAMGGDYTVTDAINRRDRIFDQASEAERTNAYRTDQFVRQKEAQLLAKLNERRDEIERFLSQRDNNGIRDSLAKAIFKFRLPDEDVARIEADPTAEPLSPLQKGMVEWNKDKNGAGQSALIPIEEFVLDIFDEDPYDEESQKKFMHIHRMVQAEEQKEDARKEKLQEESTDKWSLFRLLERREAALSGNPKGSAIMQRDPDLSSDLSYKMDSDTLAKRLQAVHRIEKELGLEEGVAVLQSAIDRINPTFRINNPEETERIMRQGQITAADVGVIMEETPIDPKALADLQARETLVMRGGDATIQRIKPSTTTENMNAEFKSWLTNFLNKKFMDEVSPISSGLKRYWGSSDLISKYPNPATYLKTEEAIALARQDAQRQGTVLQLNYYNETANAYGRQFDDVLTRMKKAKEGK